MGKYLKIVSVTLTKMEIPEGKSTMQLKYLRQKCGCDQNLDIFAGYTTPLHIGRPNKSHLVSGKPNYEMDAKY
uniref:Uncharacterized protein n=1 Tax=Rhizophora mucronata TaxID=61149 RepID=A0A2P2P152_RHIMU